MRCSACAAHLADDALACPSCGVRVHAEPRASAPPPAAPEPLDVGRTPSYASDSAEPPLEYAGILRRSAAWAIDVVLLYGALFLMLVLSAGTGDDANPLLEPAMLVTVVLGVAYFAVFESSFGGTLGKLALGIRVVRPSGRRISPGRSVLRLVGRILPFDAVVGLFSSGNRCLHDMIADTLVVRRDEVTER